MIAKQKRRPKYSTRAYNRCKVCGDPMRTLENSAYAVFVSGSLPTGERSRVLRKLAGKAL